MKFEDLNIFDIGTTIQMAGAVYGDKDRLYLCLFPEWQEGDQKTELLPMTKAQWDEFIRQTDFVETEVMAQAADKSLVKAIVRKSQRKISSDVSWRVWRRDGCKCRYCGTADEAMTVDHLVTWEAGGPSTELNMVSSCRACNAFRGNTDYAAWLQSDIYAKRSKQLTPAEKQANEALVATLGSIPRVIHKKNR